MRQCEVAAAADIGLLKVDAVDGQEVGVEIFEVVEDPEDFLDSVDDRLRQVCPDECFVQAAGPSRA